MSDPLTIARVRVLRAKHFAPDGDGLDSLEVLELLDHAEGTVIDQEIKYFAASDFTPTRAEIAMRLLAARLTGDVGYGTADIETAVEMADKLLAELKKGKTV